MLKSLIDKFTKFEIIIIALNSFGVLSLLLTLHRMSYHLTDYSFKPYANHMADDILGLMFTLPIVSIVLVIIFSLIYIIIRFIRKETKKRIKIIATILLLSLLFNIISYTFLLNMCNKKLIVSHPEMIWAGQNGLYK